MMDQLISQFPAQLREALEIGINAKLNAPTQEIRNILVTGLGGSGMGANIVIDLLAKTLQLPMSVNKGYHLPAFVDDKTLLIASSFSGNTEETIMALKEAWKRNAKIVCITSGGKMADFAAECKLDIIQLPGDSPSPRACLGYSFVQQLFILHHLGFIEEGFISQIAGAAKLLEREDHDIRVNAKEWAEQLYNKIPIIYATDGYESVAIRWRQQFNENSKMLCWHHVIPEMNHNELVGWRTEDNQFAPIFFHTSDTFERNQYRININRDIINNYTECIFNITAKGNNKMEQMMYLVYFGDWLSWYMSEKRNMDALEVKVIDYLKGELAKV